MLLVPRARFAPSPRWLVRTDDVVVGPVATDLLVRGVNEGRVPTDSWVRSERSEEWRRLEQVRELSALIAAGSEGNVAAKYARASAELAYAEDASEVFLFLLQGAVAATSSAVAALHTLTREAPLPVTACVLGLPDERLGETLPLLDPLLRVARSGECVHGAPEDNVLLRQLAARLAPGVPLAAVVMVPVFYGTELVAMLELGRTDHGYREGDAEALQRLAAFAVGRLEELS
jgi:hypothetical protein